MTKLAVSLVSLVLDLCGYLVSLVLDSVASLGQLLLGAAEELVSVGADDFMQRLRELAASRPVVVVAHRRAAVAAADTVVVVRDGAISAQGPLTDLAENQDVRRVMEEGRTT